MPNNLYKSEWVLKTVTQNVCVINKYERRESMDLLNQVLDIAKQFAIIGGGAWLVWGAIVLAGGLKDKNGPQLQSGIWQVVGGGMIIGAAALFSSIV